MGNLTPPGASQDMTPKSASANAEPAAAYPLEVVRDCGYGRVWARLAHDEADAANVMAAWKTEGLSERTIAAGLVNGGEFRVQPVVAWR